MDSFEKSVAGLRVGAGKHADLRTRATGSHLGIPDRGAAARLLSALDPELDRLHNRLWAEASRSVLLVLQAMDAGGKDGTIRRVLTGLNPQGCHVVNFKEPGRTELAHDYLWRVHLTLPERGLLGVMNRSHYEDVVTAYVLGTIDDDQRARRFRHIREWERMLVDEGTRIVKVFLHISKDEQRERLQARIDDPEKRWKFRRDDLTTRARWDAYQDAYDDAISATSTDWAPWYVVPADHRWVRDVAVARLLLDELRRLDPRIPAPDPSLDGLVVE